MKLSLLKSQKLWEDSATCGLVIIGLIASIMTIVGFSFVDLLSNSNLIIRFLAVVLIYIVLVILSIIIKLQNMKNGTTIKIHGTTVNIKQGDIFNADGWKLIPFNEYFDTNVDDIIIAKNSLNGMLIDRYIDEIDEFKAAIAADDRSPLKKEYIAGKKKWRHQLGSIKIYNDYMLLAFTHFNDQNEARLNQSEYEDCLRFMWKEICRTYANKPIFLPLLGSGITRFDGTPHKSKNELLKCMLCTLRTSCDNINKPITILLTEQVMEEINFYEVKGVN